MGKKRMLDELQERWMLGELTPAEDATRRVLVSQDAVAQRELEIYDELKKQLEASGEDEAPREFVNRVLDAAGLRPASHLRLVAPDEQPPLPRPEPSRRLPRAAWATGVAAALAAAAAAFVMLSPEAESESASAANPKAPQPPTQVTAPVREAARSEVVFTSGQVTVNGKAVETGSTALTAGERVATSVGRACFTVDPGIDVCLGQNSEVLVESLAENDVVVQVVRGEAVAALKPRKANHEFSLTGRGVSATARGTVFGLSLGETGEARVTVVEGKVEVVDARQRRSLVKAHSRVSVDGEQPLRKAQVGRAEEGQLLAVIGPRELWQERELGVLALEGAPGTQVMIGNEGPFELPVSSFVAPGKHQITVRGAGKEHTVQVEVSAGKVEAVTLSSGKTAAKASPGATPSEASAAETPAELLAEARGALKRGETSAALSAYRKLRKTHPGSPEAATVLVTVGKLELRQNAPARALAAFDSYLQRGGPLKPEALAGRVRALRALGRADEERRAIESYLASYPKGFEAISLKKRLLVLSSR